MLWFAWTALLLIVCLLGAVLVGRALLLALGIRGVSPRSSEGLAAAALLGTAAWTLVCGSLSYAGLPMRLGAPLALLAAIVLVVGMGPRRGGGVFWPLGGSTRFRRAGGRRLTPLLVLAALALGAGLVNVLPLAVGDAFAAMNDTRIRAVLSDFLQEHGFYAAAGDVRDHPLARTVIRYQQGGLHAGVAFVLASVQALLRATDGIDVHPAVSAWGVGLNVLGLFLVARWGLGVSRRWALLGAFVMAVTPNPMHSAAAHGFLPQTFGTAALLFGLALLGRSTQGPRDRHESILLGVSWAFLLSVYVELVPVLGLATAAVGARALIRSGKIAARPSLETLLWALGAAVLASNVEVVRAATAIPRQVDATVGRNIPWSWPELWSFALGTRYGGFERIQTDRSVAWAALTIVATGLLMVGLLRPVAAGRSLPLGVALGGLLALGMYFAVAVRDPWTGLSGHTWSLFKIGQWAFPLALGFESAGLALIAGGRSRGRSRPPRRRWTRPSWLRPSWIAIGMVALVVPLALPAQVSLARARAGTMRAATLSDQPFEAYRQLRDSVARLQPSRIYLIDPRGELWPRGMVAYYLSDWPIELVDERTALREQGAGARQLSLLVTQPVAGCVERLPAGVGLLEPGPVIVAVRWPDGTRETGREGSLRLPGGKTTLRVWSPRAGLAWISGRGTANAGGSRVSESRLRFETDAGQTGEVGVGEAPFTLEMEVPVGGSDLKLEAARRVELTDLTIGFADAAGASERCSAE